jgi:putative Mg2+ transporter-C (MgtC) family protein
LHPVLPEAPPAETVYEVNLDCKPSAAARIRALLLATIARLPVTLQSVQEKQDADATEDHIRAQIHTEGRNNDAIEQVVLRLSVEDDVYNVGWAIAELKME